MFETCLTLNIIQGGRGGGLYFYGKNAVSQTFWP